MNTNYREQFADGEIEARSLLDVIDQHAQRVADLESERDRLQHAYHQQRGDAQARVDAAVLRALAAEKERDEAQLLADGTGADAYAHCCDNLSGWQRGRDPDARGPEGTLCGWVDWAMAAVSERDELRARMAQIEAQEPICMVQMTTAGGRLRYNPDAKQLPEHGMALFARPVPAIPADPGMLTVSMAASSAYAAGWNDCRAKMINAPEKS